MVAKKKKEVNFYVPQEESKNRRSRYGVGINDADYAVTSGIRITLPDGKKVKKLLWICPIYCCWSTMMKRCFSKDYKVKNKTYESVTCCEEWLVFSNFKRWMEQQDWEGKELDKDLLVKDNKLYSPETCMFVDSKVNKFITESQRNNSTGFTGVHFNTNLNKYVAQCSGSLTSMKSYLGCFDTPEEAHEAWRKRKHELAQILADTQSDERVVHILRNRYSVEEWYGKQKA